MLGDGITRQRMFLPARLRGLGLRSRHDLAPAAWCACFIESAERFLDVVRGGTRMRGFFPMLMPIFGAHAFDGAYPGHARFSQYLSQQVPPSTAISFGTCGGTRCSRRCAGEEWQGRWMPRLGRRGMDGRRRRGCSG